MTGYRLLLLTPLTQDPAVGVTYRDYMWRLQLADECDCAEMFGSRNDTQEPILE